MALPELEKLSLQAAIERPQKCGCRPDGSVRPFARQLGGREGAPMRFSREVMHKSASSDRSGTHGTQTRSSRKAVFFGTYLINTTLSIDPLTVAVLIKAPEGGSSGAAKALNAGHN